MKAIARFFAKKSRPDNHILIGASMGDFIKEGHVYEIVELPMGGGFQVNDLGKSVIADDNINAQGVDQLLALSNGRHCITDNDNTLIG